MFAFAILVQVILNLPSNKLYFLLLCTLLGVVFELSQHVHIVKGTADFGDIAAYLLGCICAIGIIRLQED